MPKCRCAKRLHRTRLDAMLALAEIQRRDRPQARECREYRCPQGNGWHLTSQRKESS